MDSDIIVKWYTFFFINSTVKGFIRLFGILFFLAGLIYLLAGNLVAFTIIHCTLVFTIGMQCGSFVASTSTTKNSFHFLLILALAVVVTVMYDMELGIEKVFLSTFLGFLGVIVIAIITSDTNVEKLNTKVFLP